MIEINYYSDYPVMTMISDYQNCWEIGEQIEALLLGWA